MVKIRLTRIGRKNAPAFRIVAKTERSKRDGKSLEILGHYNPSQNPTKFEYNKERYNHWISQGAQASDTVKKLIKDTYTFYKYKKGKVLNGPLAEQKTAEAQPQN